MAAAVLLALAVLEAAVPVAGFEFDFDSGFESELVVLDAASDVFEGDPVEDVEVVSACSVSHQSWGPSKKGPPKLLPLFESSCLRRIKPSISLYDGGHGQAEVIEVRRKSVKRRWLSRNRWTMMGGRSG